MARLCFYKNKMKEKQLKHSRLRNDTTMQRNETTI